MSAEHPRAHERLREVCGEGHAPEPTEGPGRRAGRVSSSEPEHGETHGQREPDGAELVERLGEQPGARGEPGGHLQREAREGERESARERQRYPLLEPARRREGPDLRRGHADQHASRRAPAGLEHEAERLALERQSGPVGQLGEEAAPVDGELLGDAARVEVARDGLAHGVRQHRPEQTEHRRQERREHEGRDPEEQQAPRFEPSRRQDEQPDDAIGEEDVPVPDEVGVCQAEQDEPDEPSVRSDLVAGEDQRGAEEGREQVQELEVEEHATDHPREAVGAVERAEDGGVEVGRVGHGERLDVHDQDAEQTHAPEDVDASDARGGSHRARMRTNARIFRSPPARVRKEPVPPRTRPEITRFSLRKVPTQGRSRALVDALLQTTARILVRDGWVGLTTNRVAREAGVSVGSLYQYFPDKDALVHALVVELAERMGDSLVALGAQLVDTSIDRCIDAIVSGALASTRTDAALYRAILLELPRIGALPVFEGVNRRATDALADWIALRQGELHVTDPSLSAHVIVTSLDALTDHALVFRPELLESARFERELRRLVAGCLGLPAERGPRRRR